MCSYGRDSSIARIGRPVLRDLVLIPVSHGQEHLLGIYQVAPLFPVILQNSRFDD